MLLHRSARGVLSADDSYVRLRAASDAHVIERFPLDDFRSGALDAKMIAEVGLKAFVEALARLELATSGRTLKSTRGTARRQYVQRKWGITRDDWVGADIAGRTVSVVSPGIHYSVTFDELLANGFPQNVADELGGWATEIIESVRALERPNGCACDTDISRRADHPTLTDVVWNKVDGPNQASVWRCTVCDQGWTFEESASGVATATEFVQNADFEDDEIQQILAAIRGGETVMIGSGRCHTTYRAGPDGTFIRQEFDEVTGEDHPCNEMDIRGAIAASPDDFVELLRKPLRASLREALLDATQPNPIARARLIELAKYGPCLASAPLLDAVLAWPEEKPSPDIVTSLLKDKDGNSLFHAVMSAVGYDCKSAACGQFGIRLFNVVEAMLGDRDMRGFHYYRAGFRAMVGDHAGALADLEWERLRQAPDTPEAENVARDIEATKSMLAKLSCN